MREAGVVGPDETATVEQMKRFDKSRKGKKVSNDDWESDVGQAVPDASHA